MELCILKPNKIRNKDGVLEDPILWESLMKATGDNYKITSLIYNMVDTLFLDKYGGRLSYDSQGMPLLSSLLKIPAVKENFNLKNKEVAANLSKKYNAGVYSYELAVEKVGAFNRDLSFNDKYFATITEITEGPNKGKFKFDIIENTPALRRALADLIKQRTFKERLLYALNAAGVKVEYIEDAMMKAAGIKGVYSTKLPERYFDTLYNVVKIMKGEESNIDLYKEEASHLIIGIAGNSSQTKTLYRRFIESIKKADKHNLKTILKEGSKLSDQLIDDIIADVENDDNALREVAGRIIALELGKGSPAGLSTKNTVKALVENFAVRAIKTLGSRLWNLSKGPILSVWTALEKSLNSAFNTSFSTNKNYLTFALENVKDDILMDARLLAAKFMNQDLGDVTDAMKTKEERHHESLLEARVAIRMTNSFNSFIKLMQNAGLAPKVARELHSKVAEALQSKSVFSNTAKRLIEANPDDTSVAEAFISRANYNMISSLLDSIKEVVSDMKNNKWQEVLAGEFSQRLANGEIAAIPDLNEKVKGITQLLHLARMCYEINLQGESLIGYNSEFAELFDIAEKLKAIRDMIQPVMTSVRILNRQVLSASFATVNGGKRYIDRFKRMGWGHTEEQKRIYFDELFDGIDGAGLAVVEDASLWGVYCLKMGASISVINLLASNLYDFNKAESNKETYRYSQILLDLHERIKEAFGDEDTGFMCEVDDDGKATGNIVLPNFNYGMWERDYDNWKKETYKRLKEEHADELEGLNLFLRGEKLFEWFKPEYELWHQENSQERKDDYTDELFEESPFEEEGADIKFLPGEKYRSDLWDNLDERQKEFVKEYVKIKLSLDLFITDYHPNSVTSWRLPLFRDTTIAKMKKNGMTRVILDDCLQTFFEDPLDEEFGDDSCYNSEDDSFFDMSSLNDRELGRRIAVFGVNKLKDMRNVSRDVIYSTVSYAAMAMNVRSMATTAMILQNGVQVINETTVNGIMENQRQNHSGIYTRYIKFLEMLVFGQRSTKIPLFTTSKGHTFLLNKLTSFISRKASWLMLAGKFASGTVNTGTGINQILKEASVGEHYTNKELAAAIREYIKYSAEANFKEGLAPLNRSNKMYSFIRYFDALNENDSYFRDFTSHLQLGKWSLLRKLNYAMWVYSSGNHFMLTVPYIAKGMHTKLYTLNEGIEENEETLVNEDNFTAVGDSWELFDEALLLRGKNIERFKKKREKEFGEEYILEAPAIINELDEENINMWGNPYQGTFYVKNADGSFSKWDRTSLSRFLTLSRYMTDNMHGIYNSADAIVLNQHFLGAAILTMKKYMLGYIDKFTLTDRYSVAEGKDIEGSVITWAKLLRYYCFGEGRYDSSMKWKIYSMGVPIISSFAALHVGTLVISSLLGLSYFLVSRSLFNSKMQNLLMADGFSLYLIYNLKRFDMEMKVSIILRTISNLLSKGLYAHGHTDDEDDDKKKKKKKKKSSKNSKTENLNKILLNTGEEIDGWILKKCGWDEYVTDLKSTFLNLDGTIKENPKTPGLLYTLAKGIKDQKLSDRWIYSLGTIYYYSNRWNIEQETLFPFDLSRKTFEEVLTLAGSFFNLYPAGFSETGSVIKAAGNLTTESVPTYNYDPKDKTLADLFKTHGDWKEEGLRRWTKAIRTGEHILVGDNKGLLSFIDMIPYLNSLNYFDDPYKAALSYDFGRKMTSH